MRTLHSWLPPLAAALLLLPPQSPEPRGEGALNWQLGAWAGARRDAADGSRGAMTLRVASILGGAGRTLELEVAHDGGVYRGFSVQVYDPERDLWRRRYVNDVRRSYVALEGRMEGEQLVWRSVEPGRARESRLVSTRAAPDRWVRAMSVSEDGGATWRELWTDELVRERD